MVAPAKPNGWGKLFLVATPTVLKEDDVLLFSLEAKTLSILRIGTDGEPYFLRFGSPHGPNAFPLSSILTERPGENLGNIIRHVAGIAAATNRMDAEPVPCYRVVPKKAK